MDCCGGDGQALLTPSKSRKSVKDASMHGKDFCSGSSSGTTVDGTEATSHSHTENFDSLAVLKEPHPNRFQSDLPPPTHLWEEADWHFLDKVKCDMEIEMRCIDPRNGSFTGRVIAKWSLRSLNINDRTQPRVRVPGVRTQRLVAHVEESRIWRVISKDTSKTTYWEGVSVITFSGFEIFEVHDFPYDRQVINLDLFEFVWRSDKDSADYYECMQVVDLEVKTISMLPEWDTFAALVHPLRRRKHAHGPNYCSNFVIMIRMQRKDKYYITQIFLVTYLLLAASVLPLGLAPGDGHIGDRLAVHAAGLLTLVAFKYGVQHDMPTVPYSTFTSTFLTYQIVTLVAVAMESLLSYKLVSLGQLDPQKIDDYEDSFLLLLLCAWAFALAYCAFFKRREPWEQVLLNQTNGTELQDDHESEEKFSHYNVHAAVEKIRSDRSARTGLSSKSALAVHDRIRL